MSYDLLSLLLEIEMNIVSLFFVGKSAAGVDDLSAVDLSVLNVLGSSHNGYVYLTTTGDNVIPVDEIDVSKQTEVELAVLDGERFASAEEYRTKMSIGIHTRIVTRLVYVSAVLRVYRSGVTVLMLLSKVGDHLSHDVEKVVLKELEIEGIDVVRALLDHNGAGGVVRCEGNGTVLDAGSLNDLDYFLGNVVEGGDPASALQFDLFLKNFEFHGKILL